MAFELSYAGRDGRALNLQQRQMAYSASRVGDGRLTPFADSLWTAVTPIRFAGTWFPHVMTIVRLTDGNVLLHSPCRPSSALLEDIARIGDVGHVVAPNWFHDLYLREYRAFYPNATFWGPPFLRRQHPKLIDRTLGSTSSTSWISELPYASLSGLLTFDECVFFHVASRTLIVADLLLNASADSDAPLLTKLGYRLLGLDGRPKVFPVLQWFGFSARPSLRRVASQIFTWNPDRLIVGHGSPIERGASAQVRSAFRRLNVLTP